MIPITIFMGFLGSGKTTTILSLLPQLPQDYKAVLLKNEFGDLQVDSQLAKQSSLAAYPEDACPGAIHTVLTASSSNARAFLQAQFVYQSMTFSRGSAFPAVLAFQIRELEKTTGGDFKLDAVVTVIDAENFTGYEDTSPTAKMQASYTDIILINKWENITEQQLDVVYDHLNTLNDLTPKIRCNGRHGVDPQLIFGIDSKLFLTSDHTIDHTHNDEVQAITIVREGTDGIERESVSRALDTLNKESVWRVKGFLYMKETATEPSRMCILNWAFGRYDLVEAAHLGNSARIVEVTAMGERGYVRKAVGSFCSHLDAVVL
ncbi:hypothetical protein D9758_003811 [Tetrapyrgos nigripes]|uniref:CobW/HypB/UreG nucleotide-binding domain-containing protein n=1 Tax=Tetrapyrgos nigripes TaxID=182062 RepID=A0A8H5GM21_9AGAR|nr:hypothetical protein D9758_003811 [Tetrapyrgos nigripes]